MTSKILKKPSGISEEKLEHVKQCANLLEELQEFIVIGVDQANNLFVKSTLDVDDLFYLMDSVKSAIINSSRVKEQGRMN